MSDLKRIKLEAKTLESMLLASKSRFAPEAYESLKPYFSKIETMDHYEPIGKVRLVRLFMETDLSDDKDLFECYGRFANLVEGINV
ncbi:hypothetical protein [Thalassolituus sp.]|uniref:hypothetical protein n=1 Tax=Thalassolituus sp. TaxID=2030822 RepID=UPI00243C281D|nr:hypothetical protein [Thalassolituus sp.]